MRKRAHWIVFSTHTPRRIDLLAPENLMEFYYLERDVHMRAYRWCADVKQAHRFTRPAALKEANVRGADIDFHPDFRYAE